MKYEVLIVGGGPGGLAAALTLGRARRRVLLCDAGPRRNGAAKAIHNFVTRDGVAPNDFREVGLHQLAQYISVDHRAERVETIAGERDAFRVELDSGAVEARRVLLCTGMVDEMLPIPGFQDLWGHSIFQCPYCHGWEAQDRRWAYLVQESESAHFVLFAVQALGWTADLAVFTAGAFEVPRDMQDALSRAGIRLFTSPIVRLAGSGGRLEGIELTDGFVPRDVIFAHPPQRQVSVVEKLGLSVDEHGYVVAAPMSGETSIPGIFAAGDISTRMQGAIYAAAAAVRTASMINFELSTTSHPEVTQWMPQLQ